MYKTGAQRFAKWSAKYVPDTVGARFGQVKDVAFQRAQEGLVAWEAIQSIVRPILDKYGVTATDRAKYIGFANKLYRHILRHGGESAKKVAEGLKAYYVTFLNADPVILDEIINAVAGAVIPY